VQTVGSRPLLTPAPLPARRGEGCPALRDGVRAVCPRAPALGYILPPLWGSGGRRDESRMHGGAGAHYRLWQRRFCPFGVYSEKKRLEKLNYAHGNAMM